MFSVFLSQNALVMMSPIFFVRSLVKPPGLDLFWTLMLLHGPGGCLESHCCKNSNYIGKITSFKWSIDKWTVRTLQIIWTKLHHKKKQLSWFDICSVLASSIWYPKAICFLKSNVWLFLVKETFPFTPHLWAKLRYFCHNRLGAHFPAVCAVTLLSHQGCL